MSVETIGGAKEEKKNGIIREIEYVS